MPVELKRACRGRHWAKFAARDADCALCVPFTSFWLQDVGYITSAKMSLVSFPFKFGFGKKRKKPEHSVIKRKIFQCIKKANASSLTELTWRKRSLIQTWPGCDRLTLGTLSVFPTENKVLAPSPSFWPLSTVTATFPSGLKCVMMTCSVLCSYILCFSSSPCRSRSTIWWIWCPVKPWRVQRKAVTAPVLTKPRPSAARGRAPP